MNSTNTMPATVPQRALHLAAILVALAGLAYLVHALAYNFLCDDAFIGLRYSRNLIEGHGLVFNVGERVEGYTCFLWIVLIAGFGAIGVDLVAASQWVGLAFGIGAVILSYRLVLVSTNRPPHPLVAAVVPLVFAANGTYACWGLSGIETTMYVCLIVASCVATFSGALGLSSLCASALLLTRPEGVVVIAPLALYVLFRHAAFGRVRVAGWFAVWIGTLAALTLFRWFYYGDVLPNTYYAKAGGGLETILRGWRYLADYGADHEGLLFMALPLAYAMIRGGAEMRTLVLIAGGLWFSTIWVGGDGLPMYRFALGPLPIVLVLQLFTAVDIGRFALQRGARVGVVAAAGVILLLLLVQAHVSQPRRGAYYLLFKHQRDVEVPTWSQAGRWLKENLKPGETFAVVPLGAVSYYAESKVYDMMGLTDRHIAKRSMPSMGEGWAGHEKHDGQYILSLRPTYILAGNITITPKPRDPATRPFFTYTNPGVWEREGDLYETDLIARLYEPKCFQIAPAMYLSVFALKAEHRP